jgi:hypothetical protein
VVLPAASHTFALEFSSQGAPVPLLEALVGQVFNHVGCAEGPVRELSAALAKAASGSTFGGAGRCDIRLLTRNHTLEILVSANGGRVWQGSCPIP